MSADFLKIYKRLSMTIWFVRDCGALLAVDRDNGWCNKWRSVIKDASSWWVPLLSYPSKRNNLSRQDAGQNVLRFRRQVFDTNL